MFLNNRHSYSRRDTIKAVTSSIASIILATAVNTIAGNATDVSTANEGDDLIGTRCPEFEGLTWITSEPLSMAKLSGKVVLVRFWLMNCPLCKGSAPALNELWSKYSDHGLVVLGIHHPKSKNSQDVGLVREYARGLDFKFPIAVDNQWKTIKSIWLRDKHRGFTSATLLLDKHGVIRWVHSGGLLELDHNACKPTQYDLLEKEIQALLAEHERS